MRMLTAVRRFEVQMAADGKSPLTIAVYRGELKRLAGWLGVRVPVERVRPDQIAETSVSDPNRKLWYNPQAYQRVTCDIPARQDLCHFGNAGYNNQDSPGQFNLDFGMFKNFQVTESMRIQFRWEMFNATNTPYFSNPGGLGYSSTDTIVPDGSRNGEIRGTRTPMRIQQVALKIFF